MCRRATCDNCFLSTDADRGKSPVMPDSARSSAAPIRSMPGTYWKYRASFASGASTSRPETNHSAKRNGTSAAARGIGAAALGTTIECGTSLASRAHSPVGLDAWSPRCARRAAACNPASGVTRVSVMLTRSEKTEEVPPAVVR
eukprot:scaffold24548_cov35-Phaeocystis_antarctica.AAC.3